MADVSFVFYSWLIRGNLKYTQIDKCWHFGILVVSGFALFFALWFISPCILPSNFALALALFFCPEHEGKKRGQGQWQNLRAKYMGKWIRGQNQKLLEYLMYYKTSKRCGTFFGTSFSSEGLKYIWVPCDSYISNDIWELYKQLDKETQKQKSNISNVFLDMWPQVAFLWCRVITNVTLVDFLFPVCHHMHL